MINAHLFLGFLLLPLSETGSTKQGIATTNAYYDDLEKPAYIQHTNLSNHFQSNFL